MTHQVHLYNQENWKHISTQKLVHSSIIYNSKKQKQPKCPQVMDEQNMPYSHNGIPYHKKEWNIDSYHNMDEPWKHYGKWRKPDTKDHIQDSIYRKCPE